MDEEMYEEVPKSLHDVVSSLLPSITVKKPINKKSRNWQNNGQKWKLIQGYSACTTHEEKQQFREDH